MKLNHPVCYIYSNKLETSRCSRTDLRKALFNLKMILQVLVAIFIGHGVSSEQALLIGDPGNGHLIPLDVSTEDGTVVAVSGKPNHVQPFFKQSVNLYDFDKHLEARKIVEEDRCYIRRFSGTFDQAEGALSAAKAKSKITTQVSEEWNIPEKEIRPDVLEKTVGTKISDFCSGYRVFWAKANKRVTKLEVAQLRKRDVSPYFGKDGLGVKIDNNNGLSGHLAGGYSPSGGPSVGAGVKYDNGHGFSVEGGAGYSLHGGPSASVGFSWTFGK